MITLIIGGSGSGKSEYAENKALEYAKHKENTNSLLYIATMQPFGKETLQKITRHHELRKNKGFTTVEQYVDIEKASINWNNEAVVLLECMSNLLANEKYRTDRSENSLKDLVAKVVQGIEEIEQSCHHLVIVTNDVFASGESYDLETMEYISQLGKINSRLAKKADLVVEVVCGIPVIVKSIEDNKE
ncbi:MAG: bifunctional adenosylcobinamide kinase/adenosylcobinamide-phosphate guanylyltransferase [bacterium]|nr:bifunctional adenosylcobinamide kinase/adenosylcobinamide-phosphate guanylyltransferase [bacterium]